METLVLKRNTLRAFCILEAAGTPASEDVVLRAALCPDDIVRSLGILSDYRALLPEEIEYFDSTIVAFNDKATLDWFRHTYPQWFYACLNPQPSVIPGGIQKNSSGKYYFWVWRGHTAETENFEYNDMQSAMIGMLGYVDAKNGFDFTPKIDKK